jgi:hypothetical protein
MGVTYPGNQITGTEYVSGKLIICAEGLMHVSGPFSVSGTADFTGPVNLTGPVTLSGPTTGIAGVIPVVTSDYIADAGEFVPVDATTGSCVITLPDAPGDDTAMVVKMVATAAGHTVTVAASGTDVFDVAGGTATRVLSLLNQGLVLQYGAAAGIWYVKADDLPLADLDTRYLSSGGGNAVGSIAIIGGDLDIVTPGLGLAVAEGDGSDAKQGVVTLTTGGTTLVSNSAVGSSSRIFLTSQADGGTPGWLRVSDRVPGTSFTITSSSSTDTSSVAYEIFEPG